MNNKPTGNTKKQEPANKRNTNTNQRGASNRPQPRRKPQPQRRPEQREETLKISFLGGMHEIGKNLTVYEYKNDMIIVDCGLAFPDDDMPGIDIVIPDFTYLEKNAHRLKAAFITHGHEDHIGSLVYLLKKVKVPVYGTRLTLGLIEGKLREHRILNDAKLHPINPGQSIRIGEFTVEAIHVNHSIPDAVSYAITCGAGTVVQTGDFKIDTTPIDGDVIDFARFGELGKNGVLALLSDSTNAERPGYSESEKTVGESFERLFQQAGERRIIVASFASNIHRVQQIIDVAERLGRKVAVSGRSLDNVVNIGVELGYLHVPKGILVDLHAINRYPDDEVVLVTTGSQGEPMSALSRMAAQNHRQVTITSNDYVIISATPIPGNEKTVSNVINSLIASGAKVIYQKMYDVHVSGHAYSDELKLMLSLVKPKYFFPVHGEQVHLSTHADLARDMGIHNNSIFIGDVGHSYELNKQSVRQVGSVPAGEVLVDGSGIGDVGNIVLRDRKHLSEDGLIIIVASLDKKTGKTISGPNVVSRGFVYVRESEKLIEDAEKLAQKTLDDCMKRNVREWGTIKSKLRDDISRLMFDRTKRRPMVLPIIMEI